MIQTEYEFTLPLGFQDEEGTLHREGIMRLATALDEIGPIKDPRVQANEAYLVIILLSRGVTKLGSLSLVMRRGMEGLYAADLAYVQESHNRINHEGEVAID